MFLRLAPGNDRAMENAWLAGVRGQLERESGVDLALDRDDVDELLRLAKFAAQESGAKLNAPLLCFLIGRLVEGGELSVADACSAARVASALLLDGAA